MPIKKRNAKKKAAVKKRTRKVKEKDYFYIKGEGWRMLDEKRLAKDNEGNVWYMQGRRPNVGESFDYATDYYKGGNHLIKVDGSLNWTAWRKAIKNRRREWGDFPPMNEEDYKIYFGDREDQHKHWVTLTLVQEVTPLKTDDDDAPDTPF